MLDFRSTIALLARSRGRFDKLRPSVRRAPSGGIDPAAAALDEVEGFGDNPGNLRMFSYVPARLAADPALVVVLHGCSQTAAGYNHGAGWSTLAERYGFALLLPEQQRANNQNGCFNWFQPGDTRRGAGEAGSIAQMIETMVAQRGIDRRRVFITGLSAGAAMTSAMLACYPEVFSAGAIIAGLPYGAADTMQEAFASMFKSPARPAQEWGDLVRGAAPHEGRWPRVSVWHGKADTTVVPSNAREILKQWTNVHRLPLLPSEQSMVDGYPRAVWRNAAGEEIIESYSITHMAHGTPLSTGDADDECGAAGPFLLETGISSSYHIAKFFGIAGRAAAATTRTATAPAGLAVSAVEPARLQAEPAPPASAAARAQPARTPPRRGFAGKMREALEGEVLEGEVLEGEVLEGEVLDPIDPRGPRPRPRPHFTPGFDIGATITHALKAAGLMKDR